MERAKHMKSIASEANQIHIKFIIDSLEKRIRERAEKGYYCLDLFSTKESINGIEWLYDEKLVNSVQKYLETYQYKTNIIGTGNTIIEFCINWD